MQDNPYEASSAELPGPDRVPAPMLVKIAVALYVLGLVIRSARSLYVSGSPEMLPYALAWLALAAVTIGIAVALLFRMRWARIWLIVFTFVPVIYIAIAVAWVPWGPGRIVALVADLSRVAAGAMMFLPSVRRWFAGGKM